MKNQALTSTMRMMRILLKLSLLFLIVYSTPAQEGKSIVSYEIISKLEEIVKPLQIEAGELLKEDNTGTFEAYQKDVSIFSQLKTGKEKSKLLLEIKEKYGDFFNEVWERLNVDEESYRKEILSVFPSNIRERITFQEYLNFSIISSSDNSPMAPPSPAPAPSPKNTCVDVCSIAAGQVSSPPGFIAAGTGSYGNCFLKASGWASTAGKSFILSELRNNIKIPGTFPADSRKLRVKLSFELKQEATAFAILGTAISRARVETFQGNQEITSVAPVFFVASQNIARSYSEEYVIDKSEYGQSVLKAISHNVAVSAITGSGSSTECNNIKWSICEEEAISGK